MLEVEVNTISSSVNLTEWFRKANIILPRGRKFIIDALFSYQSKRSLLSFKDIRCNDYHIEDR